MQREGWKKFEVASVFVQQKDGLDANQSSEPSEEDVEYRVQKWREKPRNRIGGKGTD